MSLFAFCARHWSCIDTPARIKTFRPDIVVAISFGTRRDRLATATRDSFVAALRRSRPRIIVAYGNAANCFPGSEQIERLKKDDLKKVCMPVGAVIDCGDLVNSVTEARAIRTELMRQKLPMKRVLIEDSPVHSRSVRYIWERTFPESEIVIEDAVGFSDVESDHQILPQRNRWVWLLANMARQCSLRVFGLDHTAKVVHPTAR